MDLDLYAIEQLLQGGTDATFKAAEQIYKSGSHGESTALISMTPPSTITILAGTEVVGRTSDDREVKGIVRVSIGQGQSVMLVQYSGNEEGADVAGCYVGANTAPVYDGCKDHTTWLRAGGQYYTHNQHLLIYLLLFAKKLPSQVLFPLVRCRFQVSNITSHTHTSLLQKILIS